MSKELETMKQNWQRLQVQKAEFFNWLSRLKEERQALLADEDADPVAVVKRVAVIDGLLPVADSILIKLDRRAEAAKEEMFRRERWESSPAGRANLAARAAAG